MSTCTAGLIYFFVFIFILITISFTYLLVYLFTYLSVYLFIVIVAAESYTAPAGFKGAMQLWMALN